MVGPKSREFTMRVEEAYTAWEVAKRNLSVASAPKEAVAMASSELAAHRHEKRSTALRAAREAGKRALEEWHMMAVVVSKKVRASE